MGSFTGKWKVKTYEVLKGKQLLELESEIEIPQYTSSPSEPVKTTVKFANKDPLCFVVAAGDAVAFWPAGEHQGLLNHKGSEGLWGTVNQPPSDIQPIDDVGTFTAGPSGGYGGEEPDGGDQR